MKFVYFGVYSDKFGGYEWYWPWNRTKGAYYSHKLDEFFNSKKEMLCALSSELSIPRVEGFTFEGIISEWAKHNLRHGFFVILYDINPETKPSTFWRSLPYREAVHFSKDIVVLKTKDYTEAKRLCYSIPKNFAKAIVIKKGDWVTDNDIDLG